MKGIDVPDAEAPAPGLRGAPLLLGRYRPLARLAQGGSSTVFRGRDESIGRAVAIKVFSAGGNADVARFRDELRVLASLSHHGIVSIVDAGIDESSPDDSRPFLVMELVQGTSLRDLIESRPLTVPELGGIAFEIAEALDYVHFRGVVHRDVGPANVMITDYGSRSARPRARLTDFGLALEAAADSPRPPDEPLIGTAAYVSPEQVYGDPVTFASDIYSLGLTVLECFTRAIEFEGDATRSALTRIQRDPRIPESVPTEWADLIRRMTAHEPGERPSAADVVEAVRAALAGSARRA